MSDQRISGQDPEQIFLQQLPLIEKIIRSVCRRHACFGADAEDFGSTVKLKLVDDDYAVLRKFQGKANAKLSTYLMVVVNNQFRDFRIHKWGKWRPSAAARQLGRVAEQLERLLVRDGRSLDEAVDTLRNHLGDDAPPAEKLHEIAGRLPPRVKRRFEGEEGLENLPAPSRADQRVVDRERGSAARRARTALDQVLRRMEPDDRLMIRLRFMDDFTAGRIAGQLGLKQRRVYTRLEQLMKTLREELEAEGVEQADVREALGWEGVAGGEEQS